MMIGWLQVVLCVLQLLNRTHCLFFPCAQSKDAFDGCSVRIGDTSCLSPYEGHGYALQYKKPTPVHARSLSATLQQPFGNDTDAFSFCANDMSKISRGMNLHIALLALWEYQATNGRLPAVGTDDALEVVGIAIKINNTLKTASRLFGEGSAAFAEPLDVDTVQTYAAYAAVELQPVCALFGGLAAMEVIKSCGKYKPLDQWQHLDVFEALPSAEYAGPVPADSRYAHCIAAYGPEFQAKLARQHAFIVGCGALGNELAKNLAMIGIGNGAAGGGIHIADDACVEVQACFACNALQ